MVYLNDDIAQLDWQAALPLLSEQRRQQVLQFKYEMGRKTCAGAYLLLCEALRKEYHITELPIFEYGEHGKPFIKGHPEIHFNISYGVIKGSVFGGALGTSGNVYVNGTHTVNVKGSDNGIPEIEAFMRKNCGLYFKTIEELKAYLFA